MRGALIGLVSGANVGTQGIPDQWIKNVSCTVVLRAAVFGVDKVPQLDKVPQTKYHS